ncbi:MAG TPA: hypothetical protein DD440_02740 [Porticoccaceae bacterium]|nr:hypothetical protein [Porticoccaceae bacterium]
MQSNSILTVGGGFDGEHYSEKAQNFVSEFEHSDLNSADLTKVTRRSSSLIDAHITRANLRRSFFATGTLLDVKLYGANL